MTPGVSENLTIGEGMNFGDTKTIDWSAEGQDGKVKMYNKSISKSRLSKVLLNFADELLIASLHISVYWLAWNRVLHALQAPFKAVCRRRHT